MAIIDSLTCGFFVFLAGQTFALEITSYDDYKIYQVASAMDNETIAKVQEISRYFDLIQHDQKMDEKILLSSFLVSPNEEADFKNLLSKIVNSTYKIDEKNLENVIQEERNPPEGRRFYRRVGFHESYHSYCEFNVYFYKIAKIRHPKTGNPLAIIENIGKTYEGREMHLVKISSDHGGNKPIIFFEAGLIARDWLASAFALYMIGQLVENYTMHWEILDKIDFYIIPLSNPDGYEYSRNCDRMWQKTRSLYHGYYGTNANNNFDFHWGGKGTSYVPNAHNFKGPCPFSEPETRHIRDVGEKYAWRIKTFISLTVSGTAIVIPWRYDITLPAPQHAFMEKSAHMALEAIRKVTGRVQHVGRSSFCPHPVSGTATDYFKGVLGVDLSFHFALSEVNNNGVVIAAHKIYGIMTEAFIGIKSMADFAANYNN